MARESYGKQYFRSSLTDVDPVVEHIIDLEEERQAREVVLSPYQINARMLEMTRNREVRVMHCLPAHRGEEITDEVADGPNSVLFQQAENRMHVQNAIMLMVSGKV